jgi:metallo-beta-lactamase family protein
MKKKKKNEGLDLEPLYTTEDAMASMKLFQSADYEQKFEVIDGVYASFYDAGHILGSGLIHLELSDQETGNNFTLTFTGDLGRAGLPILKDPKIVPKSDIMITESTYGNRLHAALDTVEEDLAHVVNEVCEKGGKLIIPAFALERSQEIVYHLHLLMKKKAIPYLPIYVDSPLAGNVTEVFRTHQECFDKETCEEFVKNGENPFGFSSLTYTRSVEESKALNEKNGPMIIISASGMCEHGRILHHLKNNIDKEQNTVLIVGYQAENTLGRKLVNGNKQVNIFGAPYQVRASVYVMDAFSAHADRSDLLDYHSRVEGIKKMFLVHGEETQLNSLKANLEHNGFEDVYIPEHGEEVEIDINKLVD